jgi:hypothetical protein
MGTAKTPVSVDEYLRMSFDPDCKLPRIKEALDVLGKRLVVSVEEAASTAPETPPAR